MEFTPQQLAKLRIPIEETGVFEGRSESEIQKLLKDFATFYVTLAKINLRLHQEASKDNAK
ncbi:MAG: hypothetical protein ABA06_04445 [Parcubacteria bacterium C7867-001]|nr:MAG: hypothetical protein ABA06_04445 [Parcubacteria bacterium C7867-001]